jgi:hypothetical protein
VARLGRLTSFVGIAVLVLLEGGLSLLPGGRYGATSVLLLGLCTLAVGVVLIVKWLRLRESEHRAFLSSRRSEYALSALWVVTLGGAMVTMSVAPDGDAGDVLVYTAAGVAAATLLVALALLFVSGRRRRRLPEAT